MLHVFHINSTYQLSISGDMIVETQVTKFLTKNLTHSVTGLRYFLDYYM